MSLPLDHPVVEVGDVRDSFQAWRLERVADENTDRGRLYLTARDDPDNPGDSGFALLELHRDRDRTELVASAKMTAAQNGSRVALEPARDAEGEDLFDLGASVWVSGSEVRTSQVTVYPWLCGQRDIEEAEDRTPSMRAVSPIELDFEFVLRRVSRQFYINMQALFPPPVRSGGPLDFADLAPLQVRGKRGLPDVNAVEFWTLNVEGDHELTGFQNPGDFREWAVMQALYEIWRRKAGSEADPAFQKALFFQREAARQFDMVFPQVDVDRDTLPERPVRRRTGTLRRG